MKPPKLNRNIFDLSHERKLSCDMADLIPIMCEEVLPGDFFRANSSMVVRLNPLIAPMMHKVDVFTHFFFVPNRLVWSDWENFITGGTDGKDATVFPTRALGSVNVGTLHDYFGLPTGVTGSTIPISMLPFRAYALIWNEWFRDQNLQTAVTISKASGADSTTSVALLKRCWEKDYFTSALPWAQRGDPVSLPLGTSAEVLRTSEAVNWVVYPSGSDTANTNAADLASDGSGNLKVGGTAVSLSPKYPGQTSGLYADLTNATAATINQIRQAFQVQKWMERNARSGARYVESMLAHFGVRSSDARLQRPEFLGGGRSPVVVSEVLQTSETSANSPQGTMAGHGFSAQSTHAFAKTFEEHGHIIGLMSILPRTCYMQGVPRQWSRSSRYDFYWPEFANLGEQAVLKKEIYAANDGDDDEIFGYQGRYDEYRRRESSVHGLFRTTTSGLAHWHMARIFDSRPTLTSSFVEADPTKRVFAVPTEPTCLVSVNNDVKAMRPLPLVCEPGLVDH